MDENEIKTNYIIPRFYMTSVASFQSVAYDDCEGPPALP